MPGDLHVSSPLPASQRVSTLPLISVSISWLSKIFERGIFTVESYFDIIIIIGIGDLSNQRILDPWGNKFMN